ncbi:hypothetical protein UFOVP826_34 [uncultured Caudovirales phage]|uniref:Uncharacterized protein n=1 Tax=uncultured Caudovirales phage TaxID=2100421 RepID=A0A6J5P001_9CAUD|nr:hypothetical protein UFOVP826_34 [uncultured Caudovirales phage]
MAVSFERFVRGKHDWDGETLSSRSRKEVDDIIETLTKVELVELISEYLEDRLPL